MDPDTVGASNNERLLAAAKSDNEELLKEIFEDPESFDINYQDGLGNTALHYAIKHKSTDVLEEILSHDECDVDPINKLEGATPLHLAVATEILTLRLYLVESLLDAGADFTIRDKNGDTAQDLVSQSDKDTLKLFTNAQAQAAISKDDIADDYDDGDIASDDSE